MPKPFTATQLLTGIARVLGIRLYPAVHPKAGSSDQSPPSDDPEAADLTYLTQFCEGDRERMVRYIGMFIDSAPGLITRVQQAIADSNTDEIATQVHGFKTRWVMMGMHAAKELALEVEQRCREGASMGEISPKAGQLMSLVEKAISQLKNF